jgi:hypothetical protein
LNKDAEYLLKSTRRPLYEPFSTGYQRFPGNFADEVFFGACTVSAVGFVFGFEAFWGFFVRFGIGF